MNGILFAADETDETDRPVIGFIVVPTVVWLE
jgi:hypothetical protein